MKNLFLILVTIFLLSCKDKKQKGVSVTKIDTIEIKEENKPLQIETGTIKKECVEDFYGILNENLIGVEFLGETDEDKLNYEKYGVDFADVCYSGELMKIKIEKTYVYVYNYGHPKETYRELKIIDCNINQDTLIIKTNSSELSEIKILKNKEIPYTLFYKGEEILEGTYRIRISNFLIKEKDLEKFGGIPDCGDFDG